MARNFGRFASVPIGPQLAVQGAGLVLTTNAVAVGQARQGRSDIAISTGTRGAEFAFWGDDAVSAIVGVVPGVSAVNQSPTAAGVGWRLATGEVGSPSGNLATGLPAVVAGDIVGVRVAVGSPSTITFYRNGIQVWSGTYALGVGLVFAVSLTATKAGGLNCAVNSGQWQAQSPAAQAGWYSDAAGLAPVRVADYDFLSASSDSPAHARYEGLIADGLLVAAEIGFWPWGGEMPANSASASCSIVDGDGMLDAIAAQDFGGVAVAVRSGTVDGTVAAAATVARFVLDRIDITGEGAKSIVLRDAHDDLDQTLARGVFLPNIPTLAWSPLPVVIGAVASVPGLPVNTDGTAIYLSSRALASVDVVMDRGDIMEGGTFAVSPDQQQLEMYSPPVGPVVADVSTIGAGPAPATLLQALTAIFSAIGKASWSSADAAAIDAATGYAGVGYYNSDGATVREALAAILPSYGAWWWQDADGTLRFARVVPPEAYSGTLAFDLDRSDAVDDVVSTPDRAPNLTRRMAYRPNAQALGASDLVTDLVDVPQSRRDQLTALWRGQAYAAGPLAAQYTHADSADPFVSCFWREQDAQAEIDRVVDLYKVPRALYVWRIADPALAPKPGQIGRITHPRFGLAAGKKVLVRAVTRNPATGDCTLTFWG
ncbi:hypothetical protein [Pseudoxanthomonas indica]|uniref:Uncharacterized protein n=1 Tax=Pseudoxanthomonas indica TaxID=428993 RepID=A0A1T5JBD8_9GAMM|nr:hypothetical protein [Pseudoxanthomonas indica]GGD57768.1 hypothetical protein GCM10007235_32530 [Pseudoxanthomonas indica]SKC48731.1 hypothetical protein SAMN06296058_0678 [Pseudoxanthomonas indica]